MAAAFKNDYGTFDVYRRLRGQYRRRYQGVACLILLKVGKNGTETVPAPECSGEDQMDGKIVEHEVVRSTNVFMVAYVLILRYLFC